MQITALLYSVENDNFFTMILNGRKVYFYMQKHLEKQFAKYLRKGTYVTIEFEDTMKKHRGIVSYKVLYFMEISSINKRYGAKRVSYYSIEYIRYGIKKLVNEPANWLFLDFEMNMQDYKSIDGFQQEIIETGLVITDQKGRVLKAKHWYIRPTLFKKITLRAIRFLNYTKNELYKAVDFKTFYDEFMELIRIYQPMVIVWGKSDITQWKKTCEINKVSDGKLHFINLLQLHTNYFNYDNSPGLFSTWESYNGTALHEQAHNALEDAYVTKDVFFKFRNKIAG